MSRPAWSSALGHEVADKRIEVLRCIARSGSISQAAREVGISYKAAWQALDTLSNLAGVTLVDCAVGGAGGGGAQLTADGHFLLKAAEAMQTARQQVLAAIELTEARGPAGLGLPLVLGLRTSMRNQLPARVQSLQRQGAVVSVTLALGGGSSLRADLTRESVELLGLRPGAEVLALCKATAVRVVPAEPSVEAAPGLSGRVARAARAGPLQEVVLALDGGGMLVGFGVPGLRLRSRSRARAEVAPSAVVLATA